MTFESELGTCDAAKCELWGEVHLTCDGLQLWADALEVARTPQGEFAGATARGHAILVDGRTVIQCESIELAPDRIKGRIDAATVRI